MASRVGVAPGRVLRSRVFWLMFVMMTMMSTGGLMIISQFAAFSRDFGVANIVVLGLAALPLALVSFIFGCGMGCGQPITLMLMFSHSPQGRTGETLGLRLTVNNLMRVLGPAFFGSVGSALGLFAVFAINAGVMAAGGVIALPAKAKPPKAP